MKFATLLRKTTAFREAALLGEAPSAFEVSRYRAKIASFKAAVWGRKAFRRAEFAKILC